MATVKIKVKARQLVAGEIRERGEIVEVDKDLWEACGDTLGELVEAKPTAPKAKEKDDGDK